MVAVTYGSGRVTRPAAKIARAKTDAPRKKWFARLIDAMAESRMKQARREIRMHTQWLPYALDEDGNRLVKTGSEDMPFGG